MRVLSILLIGLISCASRTQYIPAVKKQTAAIRDFIDWESKKEISADCKPVVQDYRAKLATIIDDQTQLISHILKGEVPHENKR